MAKHYTSIFNKRQEMKTQDLEIFYYEDKELNPVSSHKHKHYEIYFFISGPVSCQIDDQTYRLSYGDICLMPPGVYHRPLFHGDSVPYKRIVLWISCDYFTHLKKYYEQLDFCFSYALEQKKYCFHNDSGVAQLLFSKLYDLIEEYHSHSAFHQELLDCFACSFLLQLNRTLCSISFSVDMSKQKPLFSQICDYIHGHLEDDLTLDFLAKHFYVSKYYIAHIFKENMGVSTHQYILKGRIHASKGSILSGMPLQEVSQYYGFSNYSTYFRAFKNEFGISPREFRDSCIKKTESIGSEAIRIDAIKSDTNRSNAASME